jgi:hypothetical protein
MKERRGTFAGRLLAKCAIPLWVSGEIGSRDAILAGILRRDRAGLPIRAASDASTAGTLADDICNNAS